MLSDGIDKMFGYIKAVEDIVDNDIISNAYFNLYNANPNFFQSYALDGTKPELKYKGKYLKPFKLFSKLKSSKYLKNSLGVYDAYVYYSKYDHFGGMFYDLSRIKSIEKFGIMNKAIKIFPKALLFTNVILLSINSSDTFLKERLDETKKLIDDMP